jgi:hypothetical protein
MDCSSWSPFCLVTLSSGMLLSDLNLRPYLGYFNPDMLAAARCKMLTPVTLDRPENFFATCIVESECQAIYPSLFYSH